MREPAVSDLQHVRRPLSIALARNDGNVRRSRLRSRLSFGERPLSNSRLLSGPAADAAPATLAITSPLPRCRRLRAIRIQHRAVHQPQQRCPVQLAALLPAAGTREQVHGAVLRGLADERAMGGDDELDIGEMIAEPMSNPRLPRGMQVGVDLVDDDNSSGTTLAGSSGSKTSSGRTSWPFDKQFRMSC